MAESTPRVFPGAPDLSKPEGLRLFASTVAAFIDNPIADVRFSPESDDETPRSVVVQVRDRLREPWKAHWWVRITFGTDSWENGPGLTVTISGAAQTIELVADQVYDVLTESDGTFTIELAGDEAVYHLTASVLGLAQASTVAIGAPAQTSGAIFEDAETSPLLAAIC